MMLLPATLGAAGIAAYAPTWPVTDQARQLNIFYEGSLNISGRIIREHVKYIEVTFLAR
jgi:hypothetical protein